MGILYKGGNEPGVQVDLREQGRRAQARRVGQAGVELGLRIAQRATPGFPDGDSKKSSWEALEQGA